MLIRCFANYMLIPMLKSHPIICVKLSKPSFFLCTDKIGVRYAGHSHWKNIAKTKATKDAAKCKLFNFYVKQMFAAVKEGPVNPKLNSKLNKIIKEAQEDNMPLATINGVLKKIENRKKNLLPTWYEYKGNKGVIFLIQAATDNRNRTRQDINAVLKKYHITKADGVRSAFILKGYVLAKPPEGSTDILNKGIEDAIEVGAEEVELDEDSTELLKFSCEGNEVNIVKSKLEKRNYSVESAEEVYIARSVVELTDEENELVAEILEKLEENPEIEKVFLNL